MSCMTLKSSSAAGFISAMIRHEIITWNIYNLKCEDGKPDLLFCNGPCLPKTIQLLFEYFLISGYAWSCACALFDYYSFRMGKKSKSTYIVIFPGVRKHNKEVSILRAPMWLDFQNITKITVSL